MWFNKKSGTPKPRQKQTSHLELTPQDRGDLVQLQSHPGYDVLLRLMAQVCENFEAALINASDPQDVLAKQALAKASYTFLNTVLATVDFEIGEATAAQEPPQFDVLDELNGLAEFADSHSDFYTNNTEKY